MPVQGRFDADFASFYDACQKAELSLKGFDSGAGQVEKSLNRMVDSFTGRKVITEATLMAEAVERIGGTTKLTEAELLRMGNVASEAIAKMRAVGADIPPGLQRIADAADTVTKSGSIMGSTWAQVFSGFTAANLVSRATSFLSGIATDAITAAGSLVDLSNKTGLSTETLQRMSFVAKQNGSDVQTFADAVFKMGVNIEGGTGKVRKGAEDLGLSWKELRAASPDQQFNMVVSALERMEDPQKRNEAAVALFGRTAKEILPAIVDGYNKVASGATVAGDAQVRAADAAGDAWDRFKARVGSLFIQSAGDVLLLRDAVSKLSDEQKQFILAMMPAGATIEDYDAALIKAAASQVDINLKVEQGTAAEKTFADELIASAKEYAGLTEQQRANIRAAIELGKSNDEIVNGLGITEATLNLLKKSWQEESTASKKALADQAKDLADHNRKFAESTEIISKLMADALAQQTKYGSTAQDFERARIIDIEQREIASLQKRNLAQQEYATALGLIHQRTKKDLDALGVDWDLFANKSITALAQQRDAALDTYNRMVASGNFFREELDKQRAKYWELVDAARNLGHEGVKAQDDIRSHAEATTSALERQRAAMAAASPQTMGSAAVFGDSSDDRNKTVRTLSGEMITPAEAKRRFDTGGSFNIDTSTAAGRAAIPPSIKVWLDAGWSLEQAVRLAVLMQNAGQGGLGAIGRDPLLTIGPQGTRIGMPPTGALLNTAASLGGGATLAGDLNVHVSGVFDTRTIDELTTRVGREIALRTGMKVSL